MGGDWTLVVLCRGDGEQVLSLLDRFQGAVDELVVVDSSQPAEAARLREGVERRGGRLFRVLPTGNGELFRPYGVAHVRTDRVVLLDADERPSDGLVRGLRRLTDADGYVLDRHEGALRATTQHLRIFRVDAARYEGPSFRFPRIDGSVVPAPSGEFLDHAAPFGSYLAERTERNLPTEWAERTPSAGVAGRALSSLWRRREEGTDGPVAGRHPSRPGSRAALRLAAELIGVREAVWRRSLAWGRFQRAYHLAIAAAWGRLTPEERAEWVAVGDDVRSAGGLRRYLNLDSVEYVDALTAEFPWDRDGPEVLTELIRIRHASGHPRSPGPWAPSAAGAAD